MSGRTGFDAAQCAQIVSALRGSRARLPTAVVDLDALERNAERQFAMARAGGVTLRIASKSVRSIEVLRRLLALDPAIAVGALTYAAGETLALARAGVRDLLLAYPVFQQSDLDALVAANHPSLDAVSRAALDSAEALERLGDAAAAQGLRVPVLLCVDMALEWLGGRVHLGVRRSPLRDERAVLALAQRAEAHRGLRFAGLLCYEAQVAGLPDAMPGARATNAVKSLVRRLSIRDVAQRRRALCDALERHGLACALVNGGGTGSLDSTTRASGVTEVAAGSGFYKPALFDHYGAAHMRALEPAACFALEVTRVPGHGYVTCSGGGYIASGAIGLDRVPTPWWPRGLALTGTEMAGEVQTPLRVAPGLDAPRLGDMVLFRHAKAGELLEHFDEVLLVRAGDIEARAKTYRGDGMRFF